MPAINIVAAANTKQAEAQFASLQSQVALLNKTMAETAMIPLRGSPAGFSKIQRATQATTQAYNHALASSGQFRIEQLKINDAIGETTEQLKRQKLGFNKTFGKESRGMMKAVYREQLALNQVVSRVESNNVGDGKTRMSLAIPTEVHKSWDTLNNRIGFFRAQLASASSELVNWGKNTQWAGRQLMAGISMPVAAFGAAAGVMAYQVDKQLTRIAKVYDTTANQNSQSIEDIAAAEKELMALRESGMKTATDAAHAYGASVTDTLDVQAELAATGKTGAQLQESTNEVMRIATLGEIDHAEATKALITLQAVLGHTAKQTGDDFNYLNSIENATSLSTNDFVAAIPRALGPIQEMGGSLQDLAILMVAMKERGIEAGEGANAIKAMMQRLYRPSQQVRQEWEQIAKVDPLQFVKEADGDVMEILPRIAEATKDLDRASRVKLLAGLFGTYQVTRMSAMLKGLDDMKNGIGQTTSVLEVNRQTAEEWGNTAEQELAKQAESAAGRFKRAWEGIRAELSSLGEPFLDVASKFLELTTAILGFVNNMPSWAKKGLIFAAMLAALVGPVVMLIGLFANFAGNIGKFGASMLKHLTTFELFTKSQVGAKIAASLAEQEFAKEATSAQFLAAQVRAVTLASNHAAVALSNLTGKPLPASFYRNPIVDTSRPGSANAMHSAPTATNSQMAGLYLGQMQDKSGRYRDPENRMRVLTKEQAALVANQKVTARTAQIEKSMVNTKAANLRISDGIKNSMSGAAVSSAAMVGSMVLMAGAAGDTGQEIGKWLLIASIAVPALQGLGTVMAQMGTRFKDTAKHAYNTTKNAAGTAAGLTKGAGAAGTLRAGIAGAGKGLYAMLGPIGLITLGLVAVTGVFMAWKKHQEEIRAEQIKTQNALSSATEKWAQNAGKVVREFKSIQQLSSIDAGSSSSDFAKTVANYQEGGALRSTTEAYDSLEGQERLNFLTSQYIDLQNRLGLNSKEAAQEIRAMMIGAGDGFMDADAQANELLRTIGAFTRGDLELQVDALISNINVDNEDTLKKSADDVAGAWSEAFATSRTPEEAQEMIERLQNVSDQGFDKIYNMLSDKGKEEFAAAGVTSIESFYEAINRDYGDPKRLKLGIQTADLGYSYNDILKVAGESANVEVALAKAVSEANKMGGEFDTMSEVLGHILIQSKSLSYEDAKKQIQAISSAAANVPDHLSDGVGQAPRFINDAAEEAARLEVNLYNSAQGLKQGETYAEALQFFMDRVRVGAGKAKDEARGLADEIKRGSSYEFTFTGENMKSILQSGYAGVQEDLSDMINDNFNDRMESAIDANTSYWDSAIAKMESAQEAATDRMQKAQEAASNKLENNHESETNALENSQERQTNSFEARWERRRKAVEKSFDARIDKVDEAIEAEQKAEEIRQRIFEAEQTRLDRLTESANRTIDFNLALQTGELDEAAKIKNSMDAAAQEWALSDAGDRGANASQRRQDRLSDRSQQLGEDRDKSLDALSQKEEDARKSLDRVHEMQKRALERTQEMEQKSLERRQEQESKHLEKVQEMNLESLEAQSEAAKEAFKAEWDARRDSLDRQLDTFKSFVPKNQKQLRAWMKEMNIDYENFGLDVLKPKSEKWGNWFNKSLRSNIRDAGRQIASDGMWEGMGAKVAKKTLLGMGFGSMGKFKKFVMTGKLPDDFGKVKNTSNPGSGNSGGNKSQQPNSQRRPENTGFGATMHTGGEVGGSGHNRKGVARTLKGLHPNETAIRAQKGEFVVNKDSYKKHSGLVNAVNDGIYDPKVTKNGNLGGAGTPSGMAGLMAGALSRMFSVGVSNAMNNAYTKASAAQAMSGSFGSIKAGEYGGTSFTAGQLANARAIASVGQSLGASSRDIVIALMTAMQESTLRNLSYGHLDSVGLFQQRDAWGSFEARTTPEQAARMFFLGGAQGQRGLLDFPTRGSMSLSEAAQSVQVSAYPDAYAKWAEEAQAIFRALGKSGGGSSAGFVMGNGKNRPPLDRPWSSSYNIHGSPPAVDLGIPVGRNVYAPADGKVTTSTDIRGYESRAPHGGLGYKSYGRYIVIDHGGASTLHAHLSQRYANAGQSVKGGSVIGKSGNTGYSFGPHLHFGATNGPMAWLKTGGQTLNDGIAMLHRGETVLTKPLSEELQHMVRAFGKAGKDKLSGKNKAKENKKFQIDPREANMWGKEKTGVDKSPAGGMWTWISGWTNTLKKVLAKDKGSVSNKLNTAGSVTGKGTIVKAGSYNLYTGNSAGRNIQDLAKLTNKTDVLNLTETRNKEAIRQWLDKQGWGFYASQGSGKYGDKASVAWNAKKYAMKKKGTRKLGDLTGNFIGGMGKRFAPYVMLEDRDTGQKFWSVTAHTVPTAGTGKGQLALHREQYKNLDNLVNQLGKSAPVFAGGDFNQSKDDKWWNNPGDLRSWRDKGIDHVFADPDMVKFLGQNFMKGLNTNHGGAYLANFSIPSHKNGAENIMFDNTLANLHKKESVLTADQSDKFRKLANNIDNVATGGGNEYNLKVYITEPNADAEEIAEKVMTSIKKMESRKPNRRR